MSKVLPLFGESLEVEPVEVAAVEVAAVDPVELEAGARALFLSANPDESWEAARVERRERYAVDAWLVLVNAAGAADPVEAGARALAVEAYGEDADVAELSTAGDYMRSKARAVIAAARGEEIPAQESPVEAYNRARAELGERLGVTVPSDATRIVGAFSRRAAGLPRAYAANFGGEPVGPPRATRVEALEDYAAAVEASSVTDAEAREAHLYALEECPESGGFPRNAYAQVSGGWPHGRVICSACGSAVSPTKTGLMRKHKPRHVADTSEFAARHFALLLEAHPGIKAPRR